MQIHLTPLHSRLVAARPQVCCSRCRSISPVSSRLICHHHPRHPLDSILSYIYIWSRSPALSRSTSSNNNNRVFTLANWSERVTTSLLRAINNGYKRWASGETTETSLWKTDLFSVFVCISHFGSVRRDNRKPETKTLMPMWKKNTTNVSRRLVAAVYYRRLLRIASSFSNDRSSRWWCWFPLPPSPENWDERKRIRVG